MRLNKDETQLRINSAPISAPFDNWIPAKLSGIGSTELGHYQIFMRSVKSGVPRCRKSNITGPKHHA